MDEPARDTPTRPHGACLLHPPAPEGRPWAPADDGYTTCGPCLTRLRSTLTEVRDRYQQLDAAPGNHTDHGARSSPGYNSRPPASLHVIAMTDPRSGDGARVWLAADGRVHHEPEHPPLSVRNVLETIAVDIAEQRDITPPNLTVPALTQFIDRHLDWVTRRELVVDIATHIRHLAAQLRPVTGEPGRHLIGLCPNTVDDGDHTRECSARLHAPPHGDTIACPTCGRRWERSEWMRLGDLLADTA